MSGWTTVASVQREYEFRVSGRLSERTKHALGDFSEMRIVAAPPETIVYGAVTDPAHLHGILTFLEGLGLNIVSVHQLPDSNRPPDQGAKHSRDSAENGH